MNTIIETIRAEIERRIKICNGIYERDKEKNWDMSNYYHGKAVALGELVPLLDTLQEQPVNGPFTGEQIYKFLKEQQGFPNWHSNPLEGQPVDLEKEIASFITQFGWGNTKHLAEKELINCTARHFYELGRQSRPKISDNSLEEEIAGMYQAIFGTDIINRKEMVYLDTFEAIARHFAKWQREQMMRSAVEGWVARDGFDNTLCFFSNKPHRPDIQEPLKVWKMWLGGCFHLPKQLFPDLKWEDEPKNVKLIIVKED